MKTTNRYELSARITRNDDLKKAVIAMLIALPFLIMAVVIYVNGKTDEDIWMSVALYAFGMVWAIPSIDNFKNAYWWHRYGAKRLEDIDGWLNQK